MSDGGPAGGGGASAFAAVKLKGLDREDDMRVPIEPSGAF
jgi:hypothetical protein